MQSLCQELSSKEMCIKSPRSRRRRKREGGKGAQRVAVGKEEEGYSLWKITACLAEGKQD
jgi:hypothetical protein